MTDSTNPEIVELDLSWTAPTLEQATDRAICDAWDAELKPGPAPFDPAWTEDIPPWSAVSGPPVMDDAAD